MICVMRVVEGPAAGMKCWLKPDQLITVGRMSSCDFSVAEDHHMSRSHLIVEGLESSFRVRDVGSSNGTFVNGTRISMVELCVGDRIKAGNSVFAIEFENEENRRGGSEQVEPAAEEEIVAPIRTLSAEDLDFSQEATQRFFTVEGVSEVANERKTGNAEMAIGQASRDAAKSSMRETDSPPAALMRHFHRQNDSLIWGQCSPSGIPEAKQIIDSLQGLQGQALLSLIINRDQLDKSEAGALDFSCSSGETRALTETLYLLTSPQIEVPLEFLKRCLGQDAVVCVATSKPLEPAWILEAIDMVSYPSLLYQLVCRSPERASKLSEGISFLIFEPNRQGELCLLTGDQATG
jgi:pSer/pThr/pTyr-binding forkhead associated (FHA) protein